MGDLQHGWPLHHVRAWGRHGIHFGLAGRTPASFLNAPFWKTALCTLDDLHAGQVGRWEALPEDLRFVVAVEHASTCYRFPHRHPDREKRGQLNARFLDAGAFREEIAPALAQLGSRLHALLLRFPAVYPTEQLSGPEFIGRLGEFLDALPTAYRYAVELHTPRFLLPGYRECLRERDVAHALHVLPGEASLLEQVLVPGILTSGFSLLRVGAEAGTPDSALGLVELIRRCVEAKTMLHVHLDGVGEGEERDMRFLSAVMAMLDPDLSRLSPIRKKAA